MSRVNYRNIPPEFILSELQRCGVVGKPAGTCYMIVCPFHHDKNPSCGVSLGDKVPAGVFSCFSCKTSGTWNKLADRIGARHWDDASLSDVNYISRKKIVVTNDALSEEVLNLSPWDGEYKTYSVDFLNKFGVKKMWDSHNNDWYMYVPMTYLKDLTGYIKAKIYPTSPGPKYWFPSNITKSLYPIDYVMNFDTTTLVLVEGLADAYRCLMYGIPTVALLGVKVTNFMMEQLDTLSIKTIILCLDGDEAGQRAIFGYRGESGKSISGLLDRLSDYNIRVLVPPFKKDKKYDPDNMPLTYIKVLQYMVKDTGGHLIGE